jgi:CrcB protein
MNLLLLAAGGAVGAMRRYALGGWIQTRLGSDFPWGRSSSTSPARSYPIGVVLAFVEGGVLSAQARLFLTIGVLGGYTTFSYETLQLLLSGDLGGFLLNAAGQLIIGLVATYLGLVAAWAMGVI